MVIYIAGYEEQSSEKFGNKELTGLPTQEFPNFIGPRTLF